MFTSLTRHFSPIIIRKKENDTNSDINDFSEFGHVHNR